MFCYGPPQCARLVHDAAPSSDVACQASISIDVACQASMEVRHHDSVDDVVVRASGSSTRPEASGIGGCSVVAHASASSSLNGGNGVSCGSHRAVSGASQCGASEKFSHSSPKEYEDADEFLRRLASSS